MQTLSRIIRSRVQFLSRCLQYQSLTLTAKMCILFSYCGENDAKSDYKLIVAENRDEYYDRPATNLSFWNDCNVVAGRPALSLSPPDGKWDFMDISNQNKSPVCCLPRGLRYCLYASNFTSYLVNLIGKDLGAPDGDGTWLAVSPKRRKLGVLLNLPYSKRADAKSRGRLVTDYVQSDCSIQDYIKTKHSYVKETNKFVLVTYDFGSKTKVHTYTNSTNEVCTWEDPCLGFSNSLPEKPLSKTEAGRRTLGDICSRLNKVSQREELIEELLALLKSKEQHLPDKELQNRSPMYKQLSSIFVSIPEGRYGTRTHTIMLLTKTGHLEIIEISLQSPVDLENPNWKRTEYQTDI